MGDDDGVGGFALATMLLSVSDFERVEPTITPGFYIDDDVFRRTYLYVRVPTVFNPVGCIPKPGEASHDELLVFDYVFESNIQKRFLIIQDND